MDTGLRTAIEAQYEAFRSLPPVEVIGCPCCTDPEELEALVRTPRRSLSAPQLEFYASSALLTVGDLRDLRHYWPRLAELSVSGELLTDAEIVFSKPRHGEWRTWPQQEKDALIGLARAQIEALARAGESIDDSAVETWVCAFGQFLDDVTVLLWPLLQPDTGAEAALRSWYTFNEQSLAKGELWDAFWEAVPESAARVRAWFALPEVTAAIHRAFSSASPDS